MLVKLLSMIEKFVKLAFDGPDGFTVTALDVLLFITARSMVNPSNALTADATRTPKLLPFKVTSRTVIWFNVPVR